MRVLILHPEDQIESGPWRDAAWHRIIDLGFAGRPQYEGWSREFGCRVESVLGFQPGNFSGVRRALSLGFGQLIDEHGLDWWDLLALDLSEKIVQLFMLERLVERCAADDLFFLSRAGFHSRILKLLAPGRVHVLEAAKPGPARLWRTADRFLRLRPRQVLEILGDKYDGSYRLRRFVLRARARCRKPVVLLPSAYGNASRTALAYASALPDLDFLLLVTRQSGWVEDLPRNVSGARLASYFSTTTHQRELQTLLVSWQSLLRELRGQRQLGLLANVGSFDRVPDILEQGLSLRDAWLQLFAAEPINAVLCADEANPYTRLPLLLARSRGLPAMACHHGAFDARYAFRDSAADLLLAKGRMELDYLVRFCGVAENKVEIAAPPCPPSPARRASLNKTSVVFFSEPYELWGGRCQQFYAQVLPGLAEVARANRLDLVVKLHPFESQRERSRFANKALCTGQRNLLRIVEGPLTQNFLEQTWCGVTVSSTAAVDCALEAIPVFLCTWLDATDHRYADQFVKFGTAARISGRDEIAAIPTMVDNFEFQDPNIFWESIAPERLRALLTGDSKTGRIALRVETREAAWA